MELRKRQAVSYNDERLSSKKPRKMHEPALTKSTAFEKMPESMQVPQSLLQKLRSQGFKKVSDVQDAHQVLSTDTFGDEERGWIRLFHYMATTPAKTLQKSKLNWRAWLAKDEPKQSTCADKSKQSTSADKSTQSTDAAKSKQSPSDSTAFVSKPTLDKPVRNASPEKPLSAAKPVDPRPQPSHLPHKPVAESEDIAFAWPSTFGKKDGKPSPLPFEPQELHLARDSLTQIPSGKAVPTQIPSLKDSLQYHQTHEVQKAKQQFLDAQGEPDRAAAPVSYSWDRKSFPTSPDLLATQPLLNHSLHGPSKDFSGLAGLMQ